MTADQYKTKLLAADSQERKDLIVRAILDPELDAGQFDRLLREVLSVNHYPPYFPADLQEAADAAGKDFPLENKTEEDLQQYWALWLKWDGDDLVEFARQFLK